jgi:hypothetical protein
LLSGSLSTPSAKQAFVPAVDGDLEIIATTTLSSTSSSISFTSGGVWSAYKHLRMIMYMKDNRGQYNDAASIYINNQTTSTEYRNQNMEFDMRNNSTWYGAGGDGSMFVSVPGATASYYFAAGVVDFYDINSTRDKQYWAMSAFAQGGTASGQNNFSSGFGVLEQGNAVTSIQITLGSASFVAGTQISLYGIRG